MSITLIIADDHDLVRQGLVEMLADSKVEIVGQAADAREAIRLARKHRPNVMLLDVRMPENEGLTSIEKIHAAAPDTRVVLYSTYDNPTYIARGFAHGAADYVLKGSTREELIASIEAAVRGEAPRGKLALHVQGAMEHNGSETNGDAEAAGLTPRESQVLRHVAMGLSNKEIGKSLEISVETVKEHVQHVFRKISVGDRTAAAVWAVRKGLV